ncbi:MAG: prenyltransferase [Deltaproteobacteria bacterium]|nr:MAG: prenyltransferase [Deltaproteobacteria bacterium]
MAPDRRHRQPPPRPGDRSGLALAPHHPSVRLLDDAHVRADRRPPRRRDRAGRRLALLRARGARPPGRARQQQHDQRLLRHGGGCRHGRVHARALRSHPLLSGLISKAGLKAAILACNLADVAIGLILLRARGWPVAAFALAGLFVSVFYVAPPLKLKHHGLGEPGVFLVWGPLMVCGTYYVAAGTLPAWVWLASVPYAIAVTTVLIGKHVDKYEQDRARGIHTLPVLLGREPSLRLNQALMIGFYPVVLALVVSGHIGVGVLLVAAAIPRLRQVLRAFLPQQARGRPLRTRPRRQRRTQALATA